MKHSLYIYKKLAKTVKLCRFYQEELLIYHACASNTCAVPTEQKNIFASNYWPWQSKKKLGVDYFKIEKKMWSCCSSNLTFVLNAMFSVHNLPKCLFALI